MVINIEEFTQHWASNLQLNVQKPHTSQIIDQEKYLSYP